MADSRGPHPTIDLSRLPVPLPEAGVQLREVDGEAVTEIAAAPPELRDLTPPDGLRLLGEIARGGMGAVLQGRDAALGREVAVKVLLETYANRPDLVQRFVEEAQIAGQLQHPSVVPVYELGHFSDNRPYFTMKLVKGQTLAKLLAARTSPASDRPRFLKVFEQVCQAMAYAHARGVIHRDLKPSNIMVGAFGEVQVMDWGLAKLLARPERPAPAEPASVIRTARSGTATPTDPRTAAGSVMGTPAYMAPEQARGEVEALDERCDVFGLGAILCEILTGQPPYTGTAEQAQAQSEAGDLAAAQRRLETCGADRELIDLTRRCLAPDPSVRPHDAGRLAAELTAYLEGVEARLRRAELGQAEAQVQAREERKRRRQTVALSAVIVALLTVGGAGLFAWQQREADHQAERTAQALRQRQTAEITLDKIAALQREGRLREAVALLEQAQAAVESAGAADLAERWRRADAGLRLLQRLETIRQRSVAWDHQVDLARVDAEYAAAFTTFNLWDESDSEEAAAARLGVSPIRAEVLPALDSWGRVAQGPQRRERLWRVAQRLDHDPRRGRFRDPKAWADRAGLERLAKEALADGGAALEALPPSLLAELGAALAAADADAIPLLTAAQERYPGDFWITLHLAMAHIVKHQWTEAERQLRTARALRPDSAVVRWALGAAMRLQGRTDEGLVQLRLAVTLDPNGVPARRDLGLALRDREQWDEALTHLRKAQELEPDEPLTLTALALTLAGRGMETKDQATLEEATQWGRRAVAQGPRLAPAHLALAMAHLASSRFEDGAAACRQGLQLLPENDPQRALFQQLLKLYEDEISLEPVFAAYLSRGTEPAAGAERLRLADFGREHRPFPAAAVRLYASAFAAEPTTGGYIDLGARRRAAGCAARAAAGLGDDARSLADAERGRLRRQARDWLQADLADWAILVKRGEDRHRTRARKALAEWQEAADLASVRDPAALARLPADERAAWEALWAEVRQLLAKAATP